MRFVHVDETEGLRAAVREFTSPDSSVTFVLVPLAYLAEVAHHEAVRGVARSCDLILLGSSGRPAARGGEADGWGWYDRLSRAPNVRLNRPTGLWDGIGVPFLQAGHGEPPPGELRRPPSASSGGRLRRLVEPVGARLRRLAERVGARYGTRVMLARYLDAEVGLASGAAPSGRSPLDTFDRYTEEVRRPHRDALAESIRRTHAERPGDVLRVAVVNWAEAMPASARTLDDLGYVTGDPTWIPVFAWLPGQSPAGEEATWFDRRLFGQAAAQDD